MNCSYCKTTAMELVSIRVKRPVPPGAKDMGFFDDTVVWQCLRCGGTSGKGIVECMICRVMGVGFYDNGVPSKYALLDGGFGDDRAFYLCCNCAKCDICKKTIGSNVVIMEHRNRPDGSRGVTHYHASCVERKKEESARKQAEDANKWREQEQREQERRIAAGLCTGCGKPLLFLDKVAKRQAHGNCA